MRLSYLSEKMLTFFIFWRIVEDIDRRKVINDVSCQRKSRDNIVLTSKHCSTRVEQQLKELKLRLKLDKVFRAELKQPDFTVILFQITQLDIITLGKIRRYKTRIRIETIEQTCSHTRNKLSSSSPKTIRYYFYQSTSNLSCSLPFFFKEI